MSNAYKDQTGKINKCGGARAGELRSEGPVANCRALAPSKKEEVLGSSSLLLSE